MHALSGLGDIAFLLPASAALAAALIWLGAWREAAAFCAALIVCMALTLAAKLAFALCGHAGLVAEIDSPSGHAALGAAFYGCAAALLAGGRPLLQRLALYVAAALVALAIAYGRLALRVHTLAEVICGLAIGAAATALFFALRGPPRRLTAPPVAFFVAPPILALLALDFALLSDRWTAESYIARLAMAIGRSLHFCR